ncbi:hypothetical protein DFH07DRAFT_776804 [Mycena maculata]|uniref:Uncharacterized protein n=1 Tax=Mycena maculata TaxID=230809 RepID=A0AAD7N4D3_9AGAR|nr:hypothetical protein DFH07DRAFT_776804 [Mycena maculata]
MGRRAKHLTGDTKRAANQLSVTKYRQTSPAKTMLAAQRASLHRRKGAQASSTSAVTTTEPSQRRRKALQELPSPPSSLPPHIPCLPPLSAAIDEHAQLPLPDNEPLFREALFRPGALDLSDIGRWKREPPFEEDDDAMDPNSAAYLSFTRSLAFVLHGMRLREQNERNVQRRMEFEEGNWDGLRDEVGALLEGWERALQVKYDPYHASREYTMLQHWLQWQARTIYHIYHLKFLMS